MDAISAPKLAPKLALKLAPKLALIGMLALTVLPACSRGPEPAIPTDSTTATAAPTATSAPTSVTTPTDAATPGVPPTAEQAADCGTNPENAPVPTAEPYAAVPENDQVSVTVTGIASGAVTPSQAAEIDVSICNDSPVSYPNVGLVVALEHCSCAANPMQIPSGTVEYLDPATDTWVPLQHPVEGGGMDHLGQFTNAQELPKGAAVTVRYRITLDASMGDGDGGVSATVVTADGPLNQLGTARLPFAVVAG